MTKDEHLKWCFERAEEYFKIGDAMGGISSFLSDANKHPETKVDGFIGYMGLMDASKGVAQARRWLEGFPAYDRLMKNAE